MIAADRVTRRQRATHAIELCERTLLALGAACLVAYAAACTHASYHQSRDALAFEQALVQVIHSEAHDQSEWSEARVRHYSEAKNVEVSALAASTCPMPACP